MTTNEASSLLGISRQDLKYWAKKIGVRMVKRGRRKRFYFNNEHIEKIRDLKNAPPMKQTQLSLDLSRKYRDEGIKTAIESAGEEWLMKATEHFNRFLDGISDGRFFLTEQVRMYANENGLPAPPSERAWGGVTNKMKRSGRIIACGYSSVSNPKAHATPATLWRKVK